jgi:cadmium resistance protein CadD (predicted permease)
MVEMLTIIAVTSGAFIGTNLDNLVLLVALHTRYRRHSRLVSAGYIAGMLLIGGVCLLIGELGEFIPLAYLGLLGVIPIATGVISLGRLFGAAPGGQTASFVVDNSRKTIFLTVLLTQLSNSADSIIAISLLLADSSDISDYIIAPTFLAMVFVFSWLARYSLKHNRLNDFLERYGHYVTPFILILVGVYILSNTATDMVPG